MNILGEFRDAIRRAGIEPPEHIEADGELHRFSSNGKPGDDAGWYALHLDGIAAGAFGCWRAGVSGTWCAVNREAMSDAEHQEVRKHIANAKAKREQAEAQRHAEAQTRAAEIWTTATPAEKHPYLIAKGVKAHGVRLHGDALMVPMRDASGTLHSLQFISPDGTKRFLTGGAVQGNYFSIGKPSGVLCVAEGFATGASIHETTGHAVAVAFNAGNLLPVARALRVKFPDAKLVVCADNDRWTEGNPGLKTKPRQPKRGLVFPVIPCVNLRLGRNRKKHKGQLWGQQH